MDDILGKIASQTMTFAIRSGIGVASSFAIGQCSRYIQTVKGSDRSEIASLQQRLETKIKIISPAIDLVEIIAARGNTSLESAVLLTKALRKDIQALGLKLQHAAKSEEAAKAVAKKKVQHNQDEAKSVIADMKAMMHRIEDAVPLISLAVTASGVTLSTTMPQSVSPSRLLQASTLLTTGDATYAQTPFEPCQIGTTFTLTMYQLFAGHAHRTVADLTWQEVASKCRVKLLRVPLKYGGDTGENFDESNGHDDENSTGFMRGQEKSEEYAYELRVVEDLDDGRVHEEDGEAVDGVKMAGRRMSIPIHQIAKIFYTNSGKLLGIDASSPILLIKRNDQAPPPRRLMERIGRYELSEDETSDDEEEYDSPSAQLNSSIFHDESSALTEVESKKKWEFPQHLDKEWLAFEVWNEPVGDDDDDDEEDSTSEIPSQPAKAPSISGLIPGFSKLMATSPVSSSQTMIISRTRSPVPPTPDEDLPLSSVNVKSSLSLLECLLRLTGLQNYQQTSHLAVHDELLNLFLSDSYGDEKGRRQERVDARRKIGFDPFGTPANPRRTAFSGNDTVYQPDSEFDDSIQYTEENEDLLPEHSLTQHYNWPDDTAKYQSSPPITPSRFEQSVRFRQPAASSSGVSSSSPGGPLFTSTPAAQSGRNRLGLRRSVGGAGSAGTVGTSPMFSSPSRPPQGGGLGMVVNTPSKLRHETGEGAEKNDV